METVINYVHSFFREMKQSTFFIIMAVIVLFTGYFFSLFLKANKKDSTKIAKISYLLMTIFLIGLIIVLSNIRG